jgi:hypothetical protein
VDGTSEERYEESREELRQYVQRGFGLMSDIHKFGDQALDAASRAAPHIHPRLNAIAVKQIRAGDSPGNRAIDVTFVEVSGDAADVAKVLAESEKRETKLPAELFAQVVAEDDEESTLPGPAVGGRA